MSAERDGPDQSRIRILEARLRAFQRAIESDQAAFSAQVASAAATVAAGGEPDDDAPGGGTEPVTRLVTVLDECIKSGRPLVLNHGNIEDLGLLLLGLAGLVDRLQAVMASRTRTHDARSALLADKARSLRMAHRNLTNAQSELRKVQRHVVALEQQVKTATRERDELRCRLEIQIRQQATTARTFRPDHPAPDNLPFADLKRLMSEPPGRH